MLKNSFKASSAILVFVLFKVASTCVALAGNEFIEQMLNISVVSNIEG